MWIDISNAATPRLSLVVVQVKILGESILLCLNRETCNLEGSIYEQLAFLKSKRQNPVGESAINHISPVYTLPANCLRFFGLRQDGPHVVTIRAEDGEGSIQRIPSEDGRPEHFIDDGPKQVKSFYAMIQLLETLNGSHPDR